MSGSKRAYAQLQLKSDPREFSMEWSIDNFLSWADSFEKGTYKKSPIFPLSLPSLTDNSNQTYRFVLRIYPNGEKGKEHNDVGLYLVNENETAVTLLEMSMEVLNSKKEAAFVNKTSTILAEGASWGWQSFVTRRAIDEKPLLTNGILTIRCSLKIQVSKSSDVWYDNDDDPATREAKRSKVHSSFLSKVVQVVQEKTCFDFKIICQEKTFDCHKIVLRTRSDVFNAMLTTADSEEAKSGILIIKDFEEETVSQMLHFFYTSDLTQDDVPMLIDLLLIGDKYNIQDLVERCESDLATKVCIDNCLEVLDVAHKVTSKHLLKKCGRFVVRNMSLIKGTDKWAKLIQDHPLAAVLEEM